MRRAAHFRKAGKLLALLAGLCLPAACAGIGPKPTAPEWFKERVARLNQERYPQLASVPQATPSTKSAADWASTESDVESARQALETSPRSQPAITPTAATGEFEAKARKEAEVARPER